MFNPYEKLNLTPDCTDAELEARFLELKKQYSEDRFKEGEEGRLGAVNLENLMQAYNLIKEQRASVASEQNASEYGSSSFHADDLMKESNSTSSHTARKGL